MPMDNAAMRRCEMFGKLSGILACLVIGLSSIGLHGAERPRDGRGEPRTEQQKLADFEAEVASLRGFILNVWNEWTVDAASASPPNRFPSSVERGTRIDELETRKRKLRER
jgi:hypothetical protein